MIVFTFVSTVLTSIMLVTMKSNTKHGITKRDESVARLFFMLIIIFFLAI